MKYLYLIAVIALSACGKASEMKSVDAPASAKRPCDGLTSNYVSEDNFQHLEIKDCKIKFYATYQNDLKFEGTLYSTSEIAGWMFISITNSQNFDKSLIGEHECSFTLYNEKLSLNCKSNILTQKFYKEN